jgi:hypothetical protein
MLLEKGGSLRRARTGTDTENPVWGICQQSTENARTTAWCMNAERLNEGYGVHEKEKEPDKREAEALLDNPSDPQ